MVSKNGFRRKLSVDLGLVKTDHFNNYCLGSHNGAKTALLRSFEREERKRRRREEKEKKVTRAGIEPTATAPSQPTRLDVSRSDHSAASKETAS